MEHGEINHTFYSSFPKIQVTEFEKKNSVFVYVCVCVLCVRERERESLNKIVTKIDKFHMVFNGMLEFSEFQCLY